MAGTLQAVIFTPGLTRTTLVPHRNHLAPTKASVLFSRSITLDCKRLASAPIRASQPSDEEGSDKGKARIQPSPDKGLVWGKSLLNFASNNFLPLALVSGVTFGLANPSLGCLADSYSLSKLSTFGIFFISGLTLQSEAVGAASRAWPVGIFGLCSILFFTPYFSRLIMQIQLQPQEFVTGLAIFSCMPTTLSSGVALTNLAGGNSALALAMTVISNLLGILIVPFSITKFIAAGVGVSVPTKQLFSSLVLTLLIPLIMGKPSSRVLLKLNRIKKAGIRRLDSISSYLVVRESFNGLADFVDQNRRLLSKINAVFLSLVPWMQVSRSRSLLVIVKPSAFAVAIGMGIALHLIFLAFNALSLQILRAVSGGSKSVFAKEENATALLLVASQKTLPVMVAVVQQLGGALGESGFLVLPCVAAHLIQIILDSFLVNFWLRKYQSSKDAKIA